MTSAGGRPWGTEGPIQAEVFVVRMRGGRLELTGPCGPDPWYIESHDEDDPMEVVKRVSTNLIGAPLLVHSTSWRRGPGGVILTFLVVVGEDQASELTSAPIRRSELARNTATDAARGSAPRRSSSMRCDTWPGLPRTTKRSKRLSHPPGWQCLRTTCRSRSATSNPLRHPPVEGHRAVSA